MGAQEQHARLLGVAVLLLCAAPAAAVHCYAFYYCQPNFNVDGFTYSFDLAPLCDMHHDDYVAQDNDGHEYRFQICGTAKQQCLPADYDPTYNGGVAIQLWGSAPNCTNTTCNNPYTNEPECCTRECAVLGVERPIIKLKDEGDPINGGLLMEHVGSPPSASDPYTCPLNKWTGAQYERKVVYDLACDRSVVGVEIDAIEQNATNPCWFTFKMRSGFSCGCVPNCNGRECGNDDCGGSCGSCGFNQICSLTQSCCTRNCGNKNCGDDGCGGKCGHCPHGEFCNEDQVCSFPGASSSGCADGGCEGGSVAPAFFVGVLVAAVLAGGLFVMKMRGIGPFAAPRRSAGSSRDGFSRM